MGNPDSKIHGVNMGPTWVLWAPDGPHVDPMNLAIREVNLLGRDKSGFIRDICGEGIVYFDS